MDARRVLHGESGGDVVRCTAWTILQHARITLPGFSAASAGRSRPPGPHSKWAQGRVAPGITPWSDPAHRLRRRNSSIRKAAALRAPSPRRPSISGDASFVTIAFSRSCPGRGDDCAWARLMTPIAIIPAAVTTSRERTTDPDFPGIRLCSSGRIRASGITDPSTKIIFSNPPLQRRKCGMLALSWERLPYMEVERVARLMDQGAHPRRGSSGLWRGAICAGSGLDRLLALAVRASPGPGQRLRV